jgi:hypothetical protein
MTGLALLLLQATDVAGCARPVQSPRKADARKRTDQRSEASLR